MSALFLPDSNCRAAGLRRWPALKQSALHVDQHRLKCCGESVDKATARFVSQWLGTIFTVNSHSMTQPCAPMFCMSTVQEIGRWRQVGFSNVHRTPVHRVPVLHMALLLTRYCGLIQQGVFQEVYRDDIAYHGRRNQLTIKSMWFGEIATTQAAGCMLAHSLRVGKRRIKKGRTLSAELIQLLLDNDIQRIIVARLDDDDLHEDRAAVTLAESIAGHGVVLDPPHTGRVNLFAAHDGLLCINAASILATNSIAEEITLSTLPLNTWVLAGRMIATSKIITYGVDKKNIQLAVDAAGAGRISVRAPVPQRAMLIQTCLPSLKVSVLDKTRAVTEQRLNARNASLVREERCNHAVDDLCKVLKTRFEEQLNWILIAGASAISDRRDVIPAAINAAGGTVKRFGLPVDPGNLLLLGELNGSVVIGLPGCARSPKYNGLDQLLDRLACKVEIDSDWLNSLSVGGLLTEMLDRPQPRVVAADGSDTHHPVVAGLVLAAGSSRRAGDVNKLLVPYKGVAMVRSVVDAASNSKLQHIVVVTGHENDVIESALADSDASCYYCASHAMGMAHSLSHGISRLDNADAVLVCLGDMPHIGTDLINMILKRATENANGELVSDLIVVPVTDGKKGNPVMIGSAFFDTLLQHSGDSGAKYLMQQYPDRVLEIEVQDDAVLVDYDTPGALKDLADAAFRK